MPFFASITTPRRLSHGLPGYRPAACSLAKRSPLRVMLAHQDSGDAGFCNVSTPAQSSGFSAREGGSGLHGMSCCRAIYSSASGCRASVGEGRLPSHVESTRAARSRTVRQKSLVVCLWSLLAPRVLQAARNGRLWSSARASGCSRMAHGLEYACPKSDCFLSAGGVELSCATLWRWPGATGEG